VVPAALVRNPVLGELDSCETSHRLDEPHYPKAGKGRPPLGLEKMLRIYFFGAWIAPSSTKNSTESRDPEMRQTKKGNK
jgi:hypothetical protein